MTIAAKQRNPMRHKADGMFGKNMLFSIETRAWVFVLGGRGPSGCTDSTEFIGNPKASVQNACVRTP
jgi:hypothetical protein